MDNLAACQSCTITEDCGDPCDTEDPCDPCYGEIIPPECYEEPTTGGGDGDGSGSGSDGGDSSGGEDGGDDGPCSWGDACESAADCPDYWYCLQGCCIPPPIG